MRKIIHSKFDLDLSLFAISDTETNNQFSDAFFTKITFPFDIDLINDLDVATDFISLINASGPLTYFDVKYVHDNTIEDAIFEIEQYQQKLSCTLTYGFDQLPSWDKKLSELSLEKFVLPVGTSIYAFANTIVSQTWPTVNYNFPQVHTDRYDKADDEFFWFNRILNNRVNGVFLTNYFDLVDEESRNYNIIQPLPYWIHVLQRGMIDSGYVLSGDILNDPLLQKACLFSNVDYFRRNQLVEHSIDNDDRQNVLEINFTTSFPINDRFFTVYHKHFQVLEGIGKYKIKGSFSAAALFTEQAYCKITHNGVVVFERLINDQMIINPAPGFGYRRTYPFEILIDTLTFEDVLMFEVYSVSGITNPTYLLPAMWYDIIPFYLYDGSTLPIISIINENKIDLTKSVPDITFGDFVKVVKNWFNYDLTVDGNFAIMNKVENLMNYDNAIDLSVFEVLFPLRKFHQGLSYLLKFQDIESTVHKFLPVFQNKNNYITSGYTTDEKTETIEILGLPLPSLTRNGSTTAYTIEDDDAKVYLVKYDGLSNGKNISGSNNEYLIPSIHLTNWYKWFRFRINSQGFTISFKAWAENVKDLTSKSKIYAYKQIHFVKTINKTEVKPGLFQVDIETETLK